MHLLFTKNVTNEKLKMVGS